MMVTIYNDRRLHRPAFSLVELLVVIGIIVVLLGLLSGAVIRVMGLTPDHRARYEIKKLEEALEKFKQRYGVYPPSKILLSNDPSAYKSGFGIASWQSLTQIWPKLDPNRSYDWSNGQAGGKKYAYTLEGDQCLVFFLGGMQVTSPGNGCIGFADSDHDPTDINRGRRVVPFFNFEGRRLFRRSAHPFFSYKDAYGNQPYAYFRSLPGKIGGYSNDCPSLGVQPYYNVTGASKLWKWYAPGRFQLICAGADGRFYLANQPYDANAPRVPIEGRDDLANFHPEFLGTPKY